MNSLVTLVKGLLVAGAAFVLFVTPAANDGEEMAILSPTRRDVTGRGFHLLLNTRISFATNSANQLEHCRVGLIERLPAGAFVDPDQVKEIERFNGMGGAKIAIITNHFVDTEKPEYASLSCEFLVTWSPKNIASFRQSNIPIHLRYHSPNARGYDSVAIDSPVVCSTCKLVNFSQEDSQTENVCLRYFGEGFFPQHNTEDIWRLPQIVSVPVGSSNDKDLVVWCTVLLVALGTAEIVRASSKRER